jgi:glucose-6-phosphate isomerase
MLQNSITVKYKDSVHLAEDEISDVASTLAEYLGTLGKAAEKEKYETPESFLYLTEDKDIFSKTETVVGAFSGNPLKYVVVVGIGGSNLGASAVYDAIFPKFDILSSRHPKLLFSDTNNSREMEILKNVINENIHDPKEIILNIITKSGTTVETIANTMFLFNVISEKFGEKEAMNRTVITTNENSPLWNIARDKNIKVLPIPKNVGGRYSVFSPAGIFPLRLAGINVSELIEGAISMKNGLSRPDYKENSALLSASIVFLSHKKKLNIYNKFFFHSELESIGKWGRQLTAESLGKKYDKDGKTVYAGMTPIVSIGTTDLHSMVQLYLGGPRDKFTDFVYAEETGNDRAVSVPSFSPFKTLVPDITGKDFSKIVSAILHGTMEAYKEMVFPYTETVLPKIDEHSLGQYLTMRMVETILLGKLWNINPFDQPEVESYKKVARELLKNPS